MDTNKPARELREQLEVIPLDDVAGLPDKLPVAAVTLLPALFQPRGTDKTDAQHVGKLRRVLRQDKRKQLTPVLVMRRGGVSYLIDGHHRIEAYKRERGPESFVAVAYFQNTVAEAVLVSGGINSKHRLPMTATERKNYAWRLVRMEIPSKEKISRASGVGTTLVSEMRRCLKWYGSETELDDSWWNARLVWKGATKPGPLTPEEEEARREQKTDEWADKLYKTFGNTLASSPEWAAIALEKYFGHAIQQLIFYLPEAEPEDLDEEMF